MIICYAPNGYLVENAEALRMKLRPEQVQFRNVQRYHNETEKCESVLVIGDYPEVGTAYDATGIPVEVTSPEEVFDVPQEKPKAKKTRTPKKTPPSVGTTGADIGTDAPPSGIDGSLHG